MLRCVIVPYILNPREKKFHQVSVGKIKPCEVQGRVQRFRSTPRCLLTEKSTSAMMEGYQWKGSFFTTHAAKHVWFWSLILSLSCSSKTCFGSGCFFAMELCIWSSCTFDRAPFSTFLCTHEKLFHTGQSYKANSPWHATLVNPKAVKATVVQRPLRVDFKHHRRKKEFSFCLLYVPASKFSSESLKRRRKL